MKIVVGQGSCGIASGAKKTSAEFEKQLNAHGLNAELTITGCVGTCYLEPIVDVYDDNGRQVGYSLPSVLGGGEDFYDMDGNPLGQSFEGAFGGMFFSGENGSHGFLDEEFMMGQNIYTDRDMGERPEPDFGDAPPFDSFDLPELWTE